MDCIAKSRVQFLFDSGTVIAYTVSGLSIIIPNLNIALQSWIVHSNYNLVRL